MSTFDENIFRFKIQSVNSLESYLAHAALLMASIRTLWALQRKAESLGIFDDDETEASGTVRYNIFRLEKSLEDLAKMVAGRCNVDWAAIPNTLSSSTSLGNLKKKSRRSSKRSTKIPESQ